MNNFQIEPFVPAAGFRNAHAQTVAGGLLRRHNGVSFSRVRLDTPDGDFVDVDLAEVNGRSPFNTPSHTPIVLLLHGLEGSARRGYACETYRQLAQQGIRAVGLNYRSCSGEMNKTTRFYHAGATDDVDLVTNWLAKSFPDAPIGLVGFSLGANLLLKYLGECGKNSLVSAAVAVSPPFDLALGAKALANGNGRIYVPRFIKSLREKVMAKQAQLAPLVDVSRIHQVRTLHQFDDWFTAPLHGFQNADDYYRQNSSAQYMPAIATPTLLLRADDDPFFDQCDIPYQVINQNPYLLAGFSPHGGHVGFMGGHWPLAPVWWAERQAARFMAHFLGNGSL
jgi:hypothetical protein